MKNLPKKVHFIVKIQSKNYICLQFLDRQANAPIMDFSVAGGINSSPEMSMMVYDQQRTFNGYLEYKVSWCVGNGSLFFFFINLL